ncbi:hypothetical protein Tco_0994238 [Tanacetum coccineum]
MDSFQGLTTESTSHGIDLWLQVQIFYDHVNPITRRTIDQSAGGKLRDRNAKEFWALLEDLALYDNETRESSSTLDGSSSCSDETYSSKKITTSCEICSGPHDTQYYMEDLEQAFVEYVSSRTDEVGEGLVSNFMVSQDARLSKFEADFKQQQSEMTNKIDTVLKAITDRIAGALPSDTVKNLKLSTSLVLSARSYPTEDLQCSTHIHGLINTITIHPKQQNDSRDSMAKEEEREREGANDTNTNAYIEEQRDTSLLER